MEREKLKVVERIGDITIHDLGLSGIPAGGFVTPKWLKRMFGPTEHDDD